ncbi:hypothetical protein QNI16_34465 [Cytophagaceae bacterium YF14B1]|uniref:Response regulatory domain-containing protein n=1 Tax=Xanthocytophaga flava TaxID=3048013 RepID=A0AAE3QV96_9BACT|nr:hypothetical protein [Xanthocytophaga flavus]MDJ1485646.1 hypothetical protein [Xanthocytophaga flavus]
MSSSFCLLVLKGNKDEIPALQSILQQNFPDWTYYIVHDKDTLLYLLEQKKDISLLLLDSEISEAESMDLLRQLRLLKTGEQLPVVGFCPNASLATTNALMLGGTTTFFQKPTTTDAMLNLLRKLPAFT